MKWCACSHLFIFYLNSSSSVLFQSIRKCVCCLRCNLVIVNFILPVFDKNNISSNSNSKNRSIKLYTILEREREGGGWQRKTDQQKRWKPRTTYRMSSRIVIVFRFSCRVLTYFQAIQVKVPTYLHTHIAKTCSKYLAYYQRLYDSIVCITHNQFTLFAFCLVWSYVLRTGCIHRMWNAFNPSSIACIWIFEIVDEHRFLSQPYSLDRIYIAKGTTR